MNARILLFLLSVKVIICLLLYYLQDCNGNESPYKHFQITPHVSTDKRNIDIINWEKLFDNSTEQK